MTDVTPGDAKSDVARKIPTSWWLRVGHDLRGPIAPIRMAIQLLRAGKLPPPEQSEAWKLIDRQLDQLLAGVDDVSELMRLEAGRLGFRPELADLRGMFDLLEARGQLGREFAKKNTSLRVESWPSPLLAMHDPQRLSTVLEFLLAKFSNQLPDGSIIVLSLRPEQLAAVWTIQGGTDKLAQDAEVRFVMGESGAIGDCEGRALLVRELSAMQAISFHALQPQEGLVFSMPLEP